MVSCHLCRPPCSPPPIADSTSSALAFLRVCFSGSHLPYDLPREANSSLFPALFRRNVTLHDLLFSRPFRSISRVRICTLHVVIPWDFPRHSDLVSTYSTTEIIQSTFVISTQATYLGLLRMISGSDYLTRFTDLSPRLTSLARICNSVTN